MSIDSCFEREMNILEKELESGAMTTREYNQAVRELEKDMSLDMRDYGEWKT